MEDEFLCSVKLAMNMVRGCVRKTVYGMDRPAILKEDLMGLCVNGNPFQDCWGVRVIHKLSDSTPDHILHQFGTLYQLVLQS